MTAHSSVAALPRPVTTTTRVRVVRRRKASIWRSIVGTSQRFWSRVTQASRHGRETTTTWTSRAAHYTARKTKSGLIWLGMGLATLGLFAWNSLVAVADSGAELVVQLVVLIGLGIYAVGEFLWNSLIAIAYEGFIVFGGARVLRTTETTTVEVDEDSEQAPGVPGVIEIRKYLDSHADALQRERDHEQMIVDDERASKEARGAALGNAYFLDALHENPEILHSDTAFNMGWAKYYQLLRKVNPSQVDYNAVKTAWDHRREQVRGWVAATDGSSMEEVYESTDGGSE